MNIAELFVRVTADTEETNRKIASLTARLDALGDKTNKAAGASDGHTLSLGRVERALASYVGHAAGANAVTESLSVAFGSFAVGGEVVAGVLLGIGAIVAIYEKLTEGTKKAKEESDKLAQSLLDQAKAQYQVSIAGRQAAVDEANKRLAAAKQETGAGFFSQMLQGMAPGGQSMGAMTAGDIAGHTQKVADAATEAQQAVNNLGLAIAHLNGGAPAAAATTKEVTSRFNELRDAADKVNAQIDAEGKGFWRNYIESTNAALSITDQLANRIQAAGPSLLDALQALSQVGQSVPTFVMPHFDMNQGLTAHQIEVRDKLIGNDNKNTQIIASTIETMASTIVNALNIGGGGRGSGIGGALGGAIGLGLGSIAGKAIGGVLGSIAPGVGTVVGSLAGSLLGGLFDHHKKAIDGNTAALNRLTSTLLNAPSGFKVGYYDNQAADAKMLAKLSRTQRQVSSRGGSTGFALAGG